MLSNTHSNQPDCAGIAELFEELGRPEALTHNGVQYRCEKGRFILERCPTDYPAETFTVPDGVDEIGVYAFRDCSGLKLVIVPESVTEIAPYAFSGNVDMTIRIAGDAELSRWAFIEEDEPNVMCPYKEPDVRLVLRRGTKTHAWALIQGLEFSFDDGLQAEEKATSITQNGVTCTTYYGVGVVTGYNGPGGALRIPRVIDLDRWMDFIGDTTKHPLVDGKYYDPDKEYGQYIHYLDIDGVMHYCTPLLATEIADRAFTGCQTLTELQLPDSMECIGAEAFSGCTALKKAMIPVRVMQIGDNAFENCPNLVIYAPEGSYAAQFAIKNGIPFVPV